MLYRFSAKSKQPFGPCKHSKGAVAKVSLRKE